MKVYWSVWYFLQIPVNQVYSNKLKIGSPSIQQIFVKITVCYKIDKKNSSCQSSLQLMWIIGK